MSDFRDLCDGMAAEITAQLGEPEMVRIERVTTSRTAGQIRDTETVRTATVAAVRSRDNARLSQVGAGAAQTQTVEFLVRAADCLDAGGVAFAPREKDRVVDLNQDAAAATYLIGTVQIEAAGAMYRLVCTTLRQQTPKPA